LPATVIVDGDRKLRETVLGVAQHHNLDVAILLCAWHLHCDLEKNLMKKTPNVDVFALKKAFYELRACVTEQLFEDKWNEFRASFGTNSKAAKYIDEQLYGQRMLWAQPWTGLKFCGGIGTTGISESVHSLFASGNSAVNTLTDVLVLADSVVIRQCDRSLRMSAKHEVELEQLTLESLSGFSVASVATLLSGRGLRMLRELNTSSSYFSVSPVDKVDAFVERSWQATDLRFQSGMVHNVSQIVCPAVLEDRLHRNFLLIRRCLSKDVDLGGNVCACCGSVDSSCFADGAGFQLPPRWELLYQGLHERRRLCLALGFNIPKEAGTTNNVTHEGLLDVVKHYEAERNRAVRLGSDAQRAHVIARDFARQFVYDGRALEVPMYSLGLWLQCGVLDGEDVVPEVERRHYCGLWFHAACIGILRAPKGNKIKERVQCMRCLQDRRYRVKPPKVDLVATVALWDVKGCPRILQNEPGG
jgi:hypothetical protein